MAKSAMLQQSRNTATSAHQPTAIAVCRKCDLERLIPGDTFQVTFDPAQPVGLFVVYEGRIDGKIALMRQAEDRPENIVSFRVSMQNMCFSGRQYTGFAEVLINKVCDEDVVFYKPGNACYSEKIALLKHTFHWTDPDTIKKANSSS